jgi:membrane-associated protein
MPIALSSASGWCWPAGALVHVLGLSAARPVSPFLTDAGDLMTSLTHTILDLAGPLVLVAVFTLPALEASTLLGIVVPGELAVVLGGVLAHQGRVPLWAVVVAGAAGAVAGDSVGYAIGRGVGERLLAHLPHRLVPPRQVERATALVRRVGGRAVFVGRFTASLRALVPGLAGVAGVPYRTFVAYNLAGGVVWATGFVLLGFAAGPAWRTAERVAGGAGLVLLGVIVAGAAAAALLHRRRLGHRDRPAPERPADR